MEQNFRSGDSVRVHAKIKEGNRERIQIFEGTVLAVRGRGENATFTVRRIGAGGVGIERIWPVNSSSIAKIEVKKQGHFRRSKIFFIRDVSTKELAASSSKKS
ncbi:MAG TPA: 50S ribosomal protein L19 [Patescibacteria group bacterium]|nr:50S ribosomal protein L19 [Patescibacteria group bacterium]